MYLYKAVVTQTARGLKRSLDRNDMLRSSVCAAVDRGVRVKDALCGHIVMPKSLWIVKLRLRSGVFNVHVQVRVRLPGHLQYNATVCGGLHMQHRSL